MNAPTFAQVRALRAQIAAANPQNGGYATDTDTLPGQPPAWLQRRRSLAFARAMRRRGWLAEEGYAPGSWARSRR